MDTAATIKKEVQDKGVYTASLPSRSAANTIRALVANGYGAKLIAKNINGRDLWKITGEP